MTRLAQWIGLFCVVGGIAIATAVLTGSIGQSDDFAAVAGPGPTPTETPPTPTYSPYSDFQAMTLQELETLQVKLTYVSDQRKTISSVAFTSPTHTLDMTAFVPFRRSDFHYGNDESAETLRTFTASPQELQTMVAAVKSLPQVTAGNADPDGILSFMLFNSTSSGDKGFEAITNRVDTEALLETIGQSLSPGNSDGRDAIRTLWTSMGFGPAAF